MRGDGDPYRRQHRPGQRFTPTCVGTALVFVLCLLAISVHPHVRGDGASVVRLEVRGDGSPPRAWGRHWEGHPQPRRHRFTPTCVGTALRQSPQRPRPAVHPHVRGDGSSRIMLHRLCYGSPPRAWGRRAILGGGLLRFRFTPTCVGTASAGGIVAFGGRFTPTCVGTAVTNSVKSLGCSVHPHVRGDGFSMPALTEPGSGSPPRAWGRP